MEESSDCRFVTALTPRVQILRGKHESTPSTYCTCSAAQDCATPHSLALSMLNSATGKSTTTPNGGIRQYIYLFDTSRRGKKLLESSHDVIKVKAHAAEGRGKKSLLTL